MEETSNPSTPVIDDHEFDLRRVHTMFDKCLEEQLDLQAYIDGYAELNKYKLNILKSSNILKSFLRFQIVLEIRHAVQVYRSRYYRKDAHFISTFKIAIERTLRQNRTYARLRKE